MMKRFLLLLGVILLVACSGGHGVRVRCYEATFMLVPVAEDAIRVQFVPDDAAPPEELVFTEKVPMPKYRVKKEKGNLILSTAKMSAIYDPRSGAIVFKDADGNDLLSQHLCRLTETEVQGSRAYEAEVAFDSSEGEHLFGTGQFQDGYLDIRGLTRRLTQVNTQISVPMILSSRGYGLLWHNYGLIPSSFSYQISTCKHFTI